jgi:AcrR family transcriptional regulator
VRFIVVTAILCRVSEPELRIDARRNVERILTAAIGVLTEDPDASMEQIAAASDVHRTTIYRRFPTREALIEALVEAVLEQARDMTSAFAGVAASESALLDLCLATIRLGRRYAFAVAHLRPTEIGAAAGQSGLADVFSAYQQANILRDDVTAPWIADVFAAIAVLALEAHRKHRLDEAAAADLLASTFLNGTRKPGRRGRSRDS